MGEIIDSADRYVCTTCIWPAAHVRARATNPSRVHARCGRACIRDVAPVYVCVCARALLLYVRARCGASREFTREIDERTTWLVGTREFRRRHRLSRVQSRVLSLLHGILALPPSPSSHAKYLSVPDTDENGRRIAGRDACRFAPSRRAHCH